MDAVDAYLAAARMRDLADRLRSRAQLAAAHSQSSAWHSLAGAAFRDRAHTACLDLVGSAAALDRVADELRARAAILSIGALG